MTFFYVVRGAVLKIIPQGDIMEKRFLLLMALLIIYGCDNVPGQYRHDKNHHEQQDQIAG